MANKKIVSFGDSFIFGSELKNNPDGSRAWPGLIASKLGVDYETLAVPGCSNDHIARQIYQYFATNSTQDTLAVINWTWALRRDFYLVSQEKWITLGPTCVPSTLRNLVDAEEASKLIDFYNTYTGRSILWNRYRSLQTMMAVQSFLDRQGVISIETYVDENIFDREFHAPEYIQVLQDLVKPRMLTFQGQTWLDWCKSHDFEITQGGWHPLEDAHNAACDLWIDQYRLKLGITVG